MNYSVVLGIDTKTIEYLRVVAPTWRKHKPQLFQQPFVVFYDGVSPADIIATMGAVDNAVYIQWPLAESAEYTRSNATKWDNPQRAKMLAGFVHIPAMYVNTPYWLKLDVDAVAVGMSDWLDPGWFDGNPSIIAPGWNYTKPANQMLQLDSWASASDVSFFKGTQPLNLCPEPGSELVRHSRIVSWCAFFSTEFTRLCAREASRTCGIGHIPVDSQDGFHFYCAQRGGFTIRRVAMKKHGWQIRSSMTSVQEAANQALQG